MTSPDFYTEKEQQLLSRIDGLCRNNTILAFSGGVDSALLLLLMKEASDKNGTRVLPVTFKTFLHPAADMTTAKRICRDSVRSKGCNARKRSYTISCVLTEVFVSETRTILIWLRWRET